MPSSGSPVSEALPSSQDFPSTGGPSASFAGSSIPVSANAHPLSAYYDQQAAASYFNQATTLQVFQNQNQPEVSAVCYGNSLAWKDDKIEDEDKKGEDAEEKSPTVSGTVYPWMTRVHSTTG
ncbi:hypothetical protein WR25_06604 [Diploscapter pachys]|uniref:Homeobox domain-containing protein n=1 Tax=Diploscapter pachys TaxID=2018661 RepID=A0A2A2KT08_9BILA|nr:hypothetical protein WR25_06604 [Diploscapter pachys]